MLWFLIFKWKEWSVNYERYSHRDLRDIHETFFLTLLSTVYFQAFFKAHKCTSEFWLINFKPQSLPGRKNSYKRFREKKNQWKRNLLYHMRSIPWVFWTIMTWYNSDAVAFALFSLCFLCLWLSGPIFTRYDRCLKPRSWRLFDQSLCEISQGHWGNLCLWTVIKRVILTIRPLCGGCRGGGGIGFCLPVNREEKYSCLLQALKYVRVGGLYINVFLSEAFWAVKLI